MDEQNTYRSVKANLEELNQSVYNLFQQLSTYNQDFTKDIKLNELANGSWSKHKVVFISVNPYAGNGYPNENKKVTNFNNNQKSKLNNVYYCDTYNGIGQSNFSCGWDCIHYNNSTYLKIYNYVINNCSF